MRYGEYLWYMGILEAWIFRWLKRSSIITGFLLICLVPFGNNGSFLPEDWNEFKLGSFVAVITLDFIELIES